MRELLAFLSALATLINKFGIWVVLIAVAIGIFVFRFDKIWSSFGGVFTKVFPVWAETRKLKIERKKQELEIVRQRDQAEWEHSQSERKARLERDLDTTIVLKDMLLSYRSELDDTKLERRQLANRLYEIVEGYEKQSVHVIEVLRDMSGLIRSQTSRLDQVCRFAEEKLKLDSFPGSKESS